MIRSAVLVAGCALTLLSAPTNATPGMVSADGCHGAAPSLACCRFHGHLVWV